MWTISPVQVQCMRQGAQGWCTGKTWGMEWGGRWEGSSGWGTHVHPWLIHVNVWQKPLQYCKVISLRFKKKKKNTPAKGGRKGNGTPLQYSCLENPMDGGAWWAAVHGVAKSQTQLSDFTFMHRRRKWQPTPVFLPGESQGRGSLVGCHLWGRTESNTTEVT